MDMVRYGERLQEAVDFLARRLGSPPRTALVLGSGLGEFADSVPQREILPYHEIPHFLTPRVISHAGRLILSEGRSAPFVTLQGRTHFYEGVSQKQVVFPVRVLALWGVQDFVVTNAAGAINLDFSPGDLMILRDHINLSGDNPLAGENLEVLGERFPDMTNAYHSELREMALQAGRRLELELKQGVYVSVKGPSYETPAEIRMFRAVGADAVGMSTVPEVISLNHMRRRVLGISCMTNMAAGIQPGPLVHERVLETTGKVRQNFENLILACLEEMN